MPIIGDLAAFAGSAGATGKLEVSGRNGSMKSVGQKQRDSGLGSLAVSQSHLVGTGFADSGMQTRYGDGYHLASSETAERLPRFH